MADVTAAVISEASPGAVAWPIQRGGCRTHGVIWRGVAENMVCYGFPDNMVYLLIRQFAQF